MTDEKTLSPLEKRLDKMGLALAEALCESAFEMAEKLVEEEGVNDLHTVLALEVVSRAAMTFIETHLANDHVEGDIPDDILESIVSRFLHCAVATKTRKIANEVQLVEFGESTNRVMH